MQAMEKMTDAWAVLDFDKDGSITVKDFETRPGATAQATEYFTKLANMLDEDHDGTITQRMGIRAAGTRAPTARGL